MEDDINCVQFARKEPQLMCPWISAAPIGCTSTIKPRQSANNMHKYATPPLEPTMRRKFKAPKTNQQQRPVDTANHFYYFLKLMQTFPDVHPATLHSVMCLSGNNFSAACETLITAKNYKENYMQRKMQVLPPRYHPYHKHLQAQTSNGQVYDIVSIVSDSDNANMTNIQYNISSNEGSEVILVPDPKKIAQGNDFIDSDGNVTLETQEDQVPIETHNETSANLNVDASNYSMKETSGPLENSKTSTDLLGEQGPEVEIDQR